MLIDMRAPQKNRGQLAVEFVLVIPFVALAFYSIAQMASAGLRSNFATFTAMYSARVAAVYQKDYVENAAQIFVANKNLPEFFALEPDLPEDALGGGDTPSPYCRGGKEYSVCGFPE